MEDDKENDDSWTPRAYPIPKHWIYIELETAFENLPLTGKKLTQKSYEVQGEYLVVDQGASEIGGYSNDNSKLINLERPAIVFGDHTRCLKFINFSFIPGADGVKVLVPRNPIDPKYAFYACKSLRLPDRGYSRHYSFLKKCSFPLAPLNEQKRIVSKIEELFSELDNGIVTLTNARKQLKVYRQAILKYAFEGKLTAKWREENADKLETPEQLLARIQQERVALLQALIKDGNNEAKRYLTKISRAKTRDIDKESLDSAKMVSLIEVCNFIVDCHNKTAPYENKGIWLIRTPCIKNGKIYLNEEARFISKITYEYWAKRCNPKSGDIIFTREAPMGEVGIIPDNTKLCMGQRMMLLRPPSQIKSKYLLYAMMEPGFQSRMTESAIGTGVKHLRVGDVEKLCIPLFSQTEQSAIVIILDKQLSVIETQEKEIDELLNKTEVLRQSILKKAFSGELVPQDPTDEPASVLLARINDKKAAQIKNKTTKKQTKQRYQP